MYWLISIGNNFNISALLHVMHLLYSMGGHLSFVMLQSLKSRHTKKIQLLFGRVEGWSNWSGKSGTALDRTFSPRAPPPHSLITPASHQPRQQHCVCDNRLRKYSTNTHTCKNTHLSLQLPGACWTALQSAVNICMCVFPHKGRQNSAIG